MVSFLPLHFLHLIAIMAAAAPTSTTFADYFREEANDANRNQHVAIAALFDPAANNNRTHADLIAAIVQHPDNMCILRVSTTGAVEVLHHIRCMPTPITGGGALAGTVLALSGDIDPDLRSATAVTLDDAHLRRATANALVPTSAHLTALLANQHGRWNSWAMLRYLHLQSDTAMGHLARRMMNGGSFASLNANPPPQRNPEPPDAPPVLIIPNDDPAA